MNERQVGFRGRTEPSATTTSGGKGVFRIVGALAGSERDLIRERPRAGLAAARARSRQGGRRKQLDPKKVAMAQGLYDARTHTIGDIARTLGVSRATLYRVIETGERSGRS